MIVYCSNFPKRINVSFTAFRFQLSQAWAPSFNHLISKRVELKSKMELFQELYS